MPDIPPIDDLENLSATGALLEAMLRQWVEEIAECAPPDIVTLSEAVDFFARLTAIRKTLIKLSRLPKTPRPSRKSDPSVSTKHAASTTLSSAPVDLPAPKIDQIRCVPDVPYDQIRPQLEQISAAFAQLSPDPHDPSDPQDPLDPFAPDAPLEPSDLFDPSDPSFDPSYPTDPTDSLSIPPRPTSTSPP